MRVLLVSHNFVPAHAAGTEIYTSELALELARRGHAVRVFAAEKDVALTNFALREREWRGIPVTEVINNLYHRAFRETWECPEIEQRFAELLDRERPELVHFQHLMYLSIGCVEQVAQRGVPVAFTLHDYWLHCARFGQRIHADRSLCERIDFARCGECLTSFKWAQTSLERTTGRVLARVRASTGLDLSAAAKGAARLVQGAPRHADAGGVDAARAAELAADVAERDRAFRERVVPRVDRFLSPSRFLRERFVEWGMPPQRIEYVPTGLDPRASGPVQRARAAGSGPGPLRVAFIGTIAPHKGVHVLLDAWSRVPALSRARATLEIIGSTRHEPEYQREIAQRAGEVGATLRGALERERVAAELAEIDLLVVPSTWWENAPLVILEARAARTPVLASNLGGMAELVGDGDAGACFRAGDADDLARSLTRFLEDPRALAEFHRRAHPAPSFAEHVARVEALYTAIAKES
jgi:glycosyltransferase involved in cell wall biosynthesis